MDKTLWIRFWKTFPFLAVFPILLFSFAYRWEIANLHRDMEQHELAAAEAGAAAAAHHLDNIVGIVLLLKEQNELRGLLETGDEALLVPIAREYLALARVMKVYDQVRYIDDRGIERVRVNNNDGHPAIVPALELQDKGDRYYFQAAMALGDDSIYVSPLDLNVEKWTIEHPYKPMIRLATPIFDAQGGRRGIVIVNFLAQHILDAVQAAMKQARGHPMMLNSEGYWLLSPDAYRCWGFMFFGQENKRMGHIYPEVWQAMQRTQAGYLDTSAGLFAFYRGEPLMAEGQPFPVAARDIQSDLSRRWYFVSHVPRADIAQLHTKTLTIMIVLGVLVVMLLGAVYQEILILHEERQRQRKELERLARIDRLTGIPNRLAFEERLEQEYERVQGQRHGDRFALLFFDLDGFKAINDHLGHQVGDQVLMHVAGVLNGNCRKDDTVARYGGDEFVVLLAAVTDMATVVAIAEKLRDEINSLSWRGHRIGASIGIAIYPDHATQLAELAQLADKAMYASKTKGKNRVTVASGGDDGSGQARSANDSPWNGRRN